YAKLNLYILVSVIQCQVIQLLSDAIDQTSRESNLMRQSNSARRNNKHKPSSNRIQNGSVRGRVLRSLLAVQNRQSLARALDPLLTVYMRAIKVLPMRYY